MASFFETLTGTKDAPGLLDKAGNVGDKINSLVGKATGWNALGGAQSPAAASPERTSSSSGSVGGLVSTGVSWAAALIGLGALVVVYLLASRGR